jgi:hypothetical protein
LAGCQPNIPGRVLDHTAADADCEIQPFEGLKMKKLLGIAALILAFTPLAQAEGLAGHEDARNDRRMESYDRGAMEHHDHAAAKHMRHAPHYAKHRRHDDHKM